MGCALASIRKGVSLTKCKVTTYFKRFYDFPHFLTAILVL